MGQGIWTIEPLPASTPVGAISMYAWNDEDGLSELNGMGWFLCDGGANATEAGHSLADKVPDMQNRFVKGGVLGQNIGVEGGSTQTDGTTLTSDQIPAHSHNGSTGSDSHKHGAQSTETGGYGKRVRQHIASNYNNYGSAASAFSAQTFGTDNWHTDAQSHNHSVSTNNTGGGEAHTHTYDPRHITVAYIIYLGKVSA